MNARTRIALPAGAVALIGGLTLSEPANAAAFEGCTWEQWNNALELAQEYCNNDPNVKVSNCQQSQGGGISFD